jgi:hypothetical protein
MGKYRYQDKKENKNYTCKDKKENKNYTCKDKKENKNYTCKDEKKNKNYTCKDEKNREKQMARGLETMNPMAPMAPETMNPMAPMAPGAMNPMAPMAPEASNVRASGFRATELVPSAVIPADTFTKVRYTNEQYDLTNEYAPSTSTFSPRRKGVYSIIASIFFLPVAPFTLPALTQINILVNGFYVAFDSETLSTNTGYTVSVSTNIQLNAGDVVEVYMRSSVQGAIVPSPAEGVATRFEATRFPSPAA